MNMFLWSKHWETPHNFDITTTVWVSNWTAQNKWKDYPRINYGLSLTIIVLPIKDTDFWH